MTVAEEPLARGEECPRCASPRAGGDPYCEACGHEFGSALWEAVVVADRALYQRLGPQSFAFPDDVRPRVVRLDEARVEIGRRSARHGTDPQIDLAGSPPDPGVSHRHAALVRQGDGTYAVIDLGSTNGTVLNDESTPIPRDTPRRVRAGDQIHLGAWTTIGIRLAESKTARP